MKMAAMWVMLLRARVHRAMFRLFRRRLIEASVALLSGLLWVSSVVQAVTLEEDDIVGLGLFSNKLIRIDGKTGKRSIISDFSNPAQGPSSAGYGGVAVSQGRIFVTGQNGLILVVDPRTGHRSVAGDFNQGAIQGSIYPGVAVDRAGGITGSVQTEGFPEFHSFVIRVVPRIDRHVILSESRGIFFTDLVLAPSSEGPAHPLGTILIGEQDHAAFYDISRLDPVTRDWSPVTDFADPTQGIVLYDDVCPSGLAAEHSGKVLAIAAQCDDSVSVLVSIDPKTGYRTMISDFNNPAQGPGGSSFRGAAVVAQNSGRIIVTANGNLYRVNRQTGKRVLFSDACNPRQGPPIAVGNLIAVVPHNASSCDSPPAGSYVSPFGSNK